MLDGLVTDALFVQLEASFADLIDLTPHPFSWQDNGLFRQEMCRSHSDPSPSSGKVARAFDFDLSVTTSGGRCVDNSEESKRELAQSYLSDMEREDHSQLLQSHTLHIHWFVVVRSSYGEQDTLPLNERTSIWIGRLTKEPQASDDTLDVNWYTSKVAQQATGPWTIENVRVQGKKKQQRINSDTIPRDCVIHSFERLTSNGMLTSEDRAIITDIIQRVQGGDEDDHEDDGEQEEDDSEENDDAHYHDAARMR